MTDINSRIVLMHTMAMLFFGAAILCLVAAVLFFYFFDLKDDIDRKVRKYKRLKKKKEAEETQEDEEEEIDEEKATPEDMEFSTLLVPEAAPPATSTRVIDGHAVDGRLEEEEEIDETGLYETLALDEMDGMEETLPVDEEERQTSLARSKMESPPPLEDVEPIPSPTESSEDIGNGGLTAQLFSGKNPGASKRKRRQKEWKAGHSEELRSMGLENGIPDMGTRPQRRVETAFRVTKRDMRTHDEEETL